MIKVLHQNKGQRSIILYEIWKTVCFTFLWQFCVSVSFPLHPNLNLSQTAASNFNHYWLLKSKRKHKMLTAGKIKTIVGHHSKTNDYFRKTN